MIVNLLVECYEELGIYSPGWFKLAALIQQPITESGYLGKVKIIRRRDEVV